jgi:hypothetical protein
LNSFETNDPVFRYAYEHGSGWNELLDYVMKVQIRVSRGLEVKYLGNPGCPITATIGMEGIGHSGSRSIHHESYELV